MRLKAVIYSVITTALVLSGLMTGAVQVNAQELTHTFVGLSPSSITETDLLRDRAIEKTVNLQRDLGTLPLTLEVEFTGPDGRFLRGPEEVFFDIGQLQTTYTFEIFPEAAATGEYAAQVSFLPKETGNEIDAGTGFGIRRGVALKVDFTVTDNEVLEYEVSHTELRQTETGLPFYFSYTVDNTGNVEWRPDRVEFSFVETFGGIYSDEYSVSGETFEPAKPGNISTVQADVVHQLPIGHYDATIDFYVGDDVIHSTPGSLIVFETGTLDQSAELVGLSANKQLFAAGENIQITARMRNNGDITTVGTLVTEVYAADGTLVDILTSDPRSAVPGQEVDIDQIVKLQEAGEYRIESFIEFAGTKVTEPMEVLVQIEDTFLSSGVAILPFILLGLAFLILLFAIFLIFRNIHRHNKSDEPPIIKTPPQPKPQAPQPSSLQPGASAVPQQTPVPPPAPKPQVTAPPVETPAPMPAEPPVTPVAVPEERPKTVVNDNADVVPASSMGPSSEEIVTQLDEMQSVVEETSQETPEPKQLSVEKDDDDMWTISL